MNQQEEMTNLEKFCRSTGLAWAWVKFETLMIWLGRFAFDKEKNEPSHKKGIALMAATTLCIGFLYLVALSPWKTQLQDLIIDYAWVLGLTCVLGIATATIAGVVNSRAAKLAATKEKGGDA